MKTIRVRVIKNGTVIDHIPNNKALKVIDILDLQDQGILTIGVSYSSQKMGKKDIIKVENKYLEKEETDKLSLIAPNATINIIKDGEIVEKRKIEQPQEYVNVVKCLNPNCITAKTPAISRFKIVKTSPIVLRCHYCERIIKSGDVEIL
ncbi:MAG: aspartate carbamoyltransferase regulatory subunit [Spirochaetota bacterium]